MRAWIALAVIVPCAPAMAAPQQLPPLTAKDVTIRMKPGAHDRYFPQAARRAHIEGQASTLCSVTDEGGLTGCRVVQAEPKGHGFGPAIVRLASHMRLDPQTKDGAPTAGRRFLLQTTFRLPPAH